MRLSRLVRYSVCLIASTSSSSAAASMNRTTASNESYGCTSSTSLPAISANGSRPAARRGEGCEGHGSSRCPVSTSSGTSPKSADRSSGADSRRISSAGVSKRRDSTSVSSSGVPASTSSRTAVPRVRASRTSSISASRSAPSSSTVMSASRVKRNAATPAISCPAKNRPRFARTMSSSSTHPPPGAGWNRRTGFVSGSTAYRLSPPNRGDAWICTISVTASAGSSGAARSSDSSSNSSGPMAMGERTGRISDSKTRRSRRRSLSSSDSGSTRANPSAASSRSNSP